MSCLLVNNIEFCSYSLGGVRELFITNKSFVSSVNLGTDGSITEFNPTTGLLYWLKFDISEEPTVLTETLQKSDRGDLYRVDLDTTFLLLDSSKRESISQLIKSDLLIVVKDFNGKYWSIGEDCKAELLNYSATTDVKRGNSRYTIKISSFNTHQMREVDFEALSSFFVAVIDCSPYMGLPITAIPGPIAIYYECLIDYSN